MTVKELRELLKHKPDDMEVYVDNRELHMSESAMGTYEQTVRIMVPKDEPKKTKEVFMIFS